MKQIIVFGCGMVANKILQYPAKKNVSYFCGR